MITIKSYTNLEQSKKLAEFLPTESADMYYCYGMDIHTKKWDYDIVPTIIDASNQIDIGDIPCWSLAALLDVLPKGKVLIDDVHSNKYKVIGYNLDTDYYDEPLDACVAMIEKLKENNKL